MIKLKEQGSKLKGIKYEWRARSFKKDILWSFNFKNNTNYMILVIFFSNSILIQKLIFVIFVVFGSERIEKGHSISAVEREKYRWHRFRPPK